MASTPGSNPTAHGGADRSHFHKTVALQEWWLIRVPNDGGGGGGSERLAVAGVDCGGELQPRRVFVSAPITKRFDSFCVETEDGRWVLINGFLNSQRTTENGFSPEVVRSFRFGFPPDWEECVPKFLGGGSAPTCDVSENIRHSDELASHPGVIERSIPTSVHNHEEISLEHSLKLSRNVAVDNSEVDDLPKTGTVNTESSDFQSIDRPKHRGGNQKKQISRCCTKQKTATSSHASEVIESLGGPSGATAQSGGNVDISGEYPRNSVRRVSKRKRRFCKTLRRPKQRVGTGLNSKRSIGDSVSAVSKSVENTVQNDNCKGGRSMSHHFDSELQELNNLNVTKKLDFQCLEADLQPTCKAKQGRNGGNIPDQGAASEGTSEDTNNRLWTSRLNERNEGFEGRVEDQNEVVVPISKRRKSETPSSEAGISREGVQNPCDVVQSSVESGMTGDGFQWRKCGQKVVTGNPYPRRYYRCSSLKCSVRKYVERVSSDPKAFITTYKGKHNHDMPLGNTNPAASEKDTQAKKSHE